MKNLLVLILLCVSVQSFSQDDEYSNINWLTDLEEAKKESATSNKPILIYFTGSDWCPPCKMLKSDFFNSEAFEKKSENFVLLMVDMPRRQDIITKEQRVKNKKVVNIYNKKGSYPNLVGINAKGKVLGELSGYTFLRETDRHFEFIDSIIQKN